MLFIIALVASVLWSHWCWVSQFSCLMVLTTLLSAGALNYTALCAYWHQETRWWWWRWRWWWWWWWWWWLNYSHYAAITKPDRLAKDIRISLGISQMIHFYIQAGIGWRCDMRYKGSNTTLTYLPLIQRLSLNCFVEIPVAWMSYKLLPFFRGWVDTVLQSCQVPLGWQEAQVVVCGCVFQIFHPFFGCSEVTRKEEMWKCTLTHCNIFLSKILLASKNRGNTTQVIVFQIAHFRNLCSHI